MCKVNSHCTVVEYLYCIPALPIFSLLLASLREGHGSGGLILGGMKWGHLAEMEIADPSSGFLCNCLFPSDFPPTTFSLC